MALTRRAILALMLVAVVLVAPLTGMALADPTVDTESSTTSSESELTDGDTITYNASTNSTMQANFSSNNGSFKIIQDEGSYMLSEYQNASNASQIEVVDGSNNHLNLTLADDETGYWGVEADAGENVTLTYRLINDTNNASTNTTNVTINWANADNKSFIRGNSSETETAEVGTLASIKASLPLVGSDNTTEPAKVEQDIGVNGADQDEITVFVESADAEDALGETYDAADADGDVTYDGWVTVEGEFVPVLASEDDAPDWVETDNETYATVNSDGDEVVIHNAGDKLGSDTENATIQVVGNEAMSIWQIKGMVSEYGGGVLTQVTEMLGGEATSVRDQFEVAGA